MAKHTLFKEMNAVPSYALSILQQKMKADHYIILQSLIQSWPTEMENIGVSLRNRTGQYHQGSTALIN